MWSIIDIGQDVVEAINAGESPIHEPGLDSLLETHGGNGLTATTDYTEILDSDITFLAFPTPTSDDGSIDTTIIETAADTVGQTLQEKAGDHVVVTKSTVVPTTTTEILSPAIAEGSGKAIGDDLHVAMNPEFLREGTQSATSRTQTRSSSARSQTMKLLLKHSTKYSNRSLMRLSHQSSKQVSKRRR